MKERRMSIWKKLMFWVRESLIYAYWLGLYETLRWGSGMGMSHATNDDWTNAYGVGMNHAEWLTGDSEIYVPDEKDAS
jgi:hypothetical protein